MSVRSKVIEKIGINIISLSMLREQGFKKFDGNWTQFIKTSIVTTTEQLSRQIAQTHFSAFANTV